jgi:quercetin dioxygenase-like cupin family protein
MTNFAQFANVATVIGVSDASVVDLMEPSGIGPLSGTETDDLNATLLVWPAGRGAAEHVNSERDVLLLVLEGQATVTLDGSERLIRAGEAVVVGKGRSRRLSAGPEGVRYVAVHRRRGPLQIGSKGRR